MNEKEVKAIQMLATALGRDLDRAVREKAALEDKLKQANFVIKCLEEENDRLREREMTDEDLDCLFKNGYC